MQRSGTLMTQDGLGLHLTRWEPDASSRAVVYLIHGLGDHSGRYTHVAEALSEARISCWALDLRGHGKSDGARGPPPTPGLRLRFSPPGYKLVLAKLLPKVIPALALPNGLDVDAISRDRTIVKSYVNDPLVPPRITTPLVAH